MKAPSIIVALALGLAGLLARPGGVHAADGIHWTLIGQSSVTFDWRGPETSIAYGPTIAYGTTVMAVPPSPMPISSTGPYWEARLTGLTENRLYHYSIGGGPDHTFRTPLPHGASGFTVCFEADVGSTAQYPRVAAVQADIAAQQPVFTLVVGDLAYGDAGGADPVDQHFNDVMVWSQDAAYMPIWGNHEWGHPPDDFANYKGRFDLPHPRTSPNAPAEGCCGKDWYWFDYGNTRFIAGPEPYPTAWSDWAVRAAAVMDSAEADPAIRYIVTFVHRPAFSSGYHPGDATLQGYLGALAATHSKYVLNLGGHSHDYERSWPQSGVVHLIEGGGGSTLESTLDPACLWLGGCPAPSWSAFRAMHHGSMRLRFTATGIAGWAICGPPGDLGANLNDISCVEGAVIDSFAIGSPYPLAVDLPITREAPMFVAYPNPARHTVTVALVLARASRLSLELVDATGRAVGEPVSGRREAGAHLILMHIPTSTPPGAYWVRLTREGRSTIRKVAILR